MKKLITANDIRAAHARGEQAMSVVLRASIITPEAREVAELLGFTITECDESVPASTSAQACKSESQRIREAIIAQLPEGQFTESLVAQLMEKVLKEKQSLELGTMQPSFTSVTGTLVRRHLDTLEQQLGCRFTHAATSFPPGTDPRISINVLESAGLEVSHVLDEPTAVADLLALDNAGVVDIGGGTTGIAIVKQGKVTYSADEATGGHHISLTLAGNRRIPLEEAEQYKRSNAQEIWPVVKPVYEKMAEIVARHIEGQGIADLWLAGGSCMQPGVEALFRQRFPELQVHLPQHSLFMTPLAIANSGRAKAEGLYAS